MLWIFLEGSVRPHIQCIQKKCKVQHSHDFLAPTALFGINHLASLSRKWKQDKTNHLKALQVTTQTIFSINICHTEQLRQKYFTKQQPSKKQSKTLHLKAMRQGLATTNRGV